MSFWRGGAMAPPDSIPDYREIDLFEKLLLEGFTVGRYDGRWRLFDADGEAVSENETLGGLMRDLMRTYG